MARPAASSVLFGLLLGPFWTLSAPAAGLAQTIAGPAPVEPEERRVEVDGRAMRVRTAGLDTRRPGEPVVVFENGALAPLEAWGDIPARVAAFAPVVAYDRSTIGQSEWDGEIGTPSHVTARLRALLATLGVDPPYVLVGWSWGGDLVRYHAGSHPEDIAGLVHVDPAGHSPSAALSVLRALGLGEAEYAADVEAMDGALPTLPPAGQADVRAINQLYTDGAEPDYGPVPPVPTAVLLAGKFRPPSPSEVEAFGDVPYDRRAHFEARLRSKLGRLSEWALGAPEGLLVVARNSGHAIQTDEPMLVVDAIRRVVFPDRARQLRTAIGREGAAAPAAAETHRMLADTILSMSHDLAESWSRLEPDRYLARFSDDLVFYIQGSRLSREDFTRAVREIMGSARESSFEVLEPEVEVLGPDAAVISFQWSEATVDAEGTTTDQAGAITLVYERRDGDWLVVRAHESIRRNP